MEQRSLSAEERRRRDQREALVPVRAFGVLPSDRRFRLGRARFVLMADALAELEPGSRVLDAGIGQAKLEKVYDHRHPQRPLTWVGVDLLRFRLELRAEVEGIERCQADLARLPFADHSFAAVACSWVFQHLADPQAALGELVRVLRPGGILLLAVPHRPQPLKLLAEVLHPLWTRLERRWQGEFSYLPQHQFYDLPRVRRLVRRAGLEVRSWQGIGFVTGGPLKPLENLEWYYRLNLRLGRAWPGLTQSLVCAALKPEASDTGPG